MRQLLTALLLCCPWAVSPGADRHVDPIRGNDAADGLLEPVRTIARAIRLAKPGDTIHLRPEVYHDWAPFFDVSGTEGEPITLDGHGATLDGCDRLSGDGWVETTPGLFHHTDLLPLTDAIIDRWFFVLDGRLNRMNRCSKGPSQPLKAPAELQPGEWTFVKDEVRTRSARAGYIFGTFWLKLPPGETFTTTSIEAPLRPAGVLIHGASSHLVIRNLTATRPYNDGFNLSDCREVVFENIRAIDCGDDGISAHGACRYEVHGFVSRGNATGICDTGESITRYRNVLIRDCIGFDLYFLERGDYALRDSLVISSAARALSLLGSDPPAPPCRLTLDNVLIRREGSAGEVRVSPGCVLKGRHVTLWNLDLQATGGTIELDRCLIGGEIQEAVSRRPRLHLWKEAIWRGADNWYDLESIRVGNRSFAEGALTEFTTAVAQEVRGTWRSAPPPEREAADAGAHPGSLPRDE